MNKLKLQLQKYDEAYYHKTEHLISDAEYNALVDQYELQYGKYIKSICSDELQKSPMYSPSLDKLKTKKDLDHWESTRVGEKILSDKIDGMSVTIDYNDKITIFTHSDAIYGRDISHLLPYLNIPKHPIKNLKVRGELTIKLSTFEKYKNNYNSPRNMIPGVVNRKEPSDILRDFDYLVYQVEIGEPITPEEQFSLALKYNFNIVTGIQKVNSLNYDDMVNDLKSAESPFPTGPCLYPRDGKTIAYNIYEAPSPNLPSHKIAFKILGETAETTVIKVEWNESRNCLLKPRVNIEEVFLDGGKLNWTSGFNADFIVKNNIGPGTKLLITRSGCINPYILEVIEGTEASLPTCEYEWDMTKVNIVCKLNDNVLIKRLYYFFDLLGAKYLGLKIVEKIYHGGYKTISSILSITIDQLTSIKGFQLKGAQRIINAINTAIKNATLTKIMTGSCLFPGFGEIKIDTILSYIPRLYDILLYTLPCDISIEEIKNVPGIDTLGELFLDRLGEFQEFLDELIIKQNLINKNNVCNYDVNFDNVEYNIEDGCINPPDLIPEYKGLPLKGLYLVFSGDKKLTNTVKELGAIVDVGIRKRTTMLIVDQVGTMNNKEKECIEKKIPIMALKDFKLKYQL